MMAAAPVSVAAFTNGGSTRPWSAIANAINTGGWKTYTILSSGKLSAELGDFVIQQYVASRLGGARISLPFHRAERQQNGLGRGIVLRQQQPLLWVLCECPDAAANA